MLRGSHASRGPAMTVLALALVAILAGLNAASVTAKAKPWPPRDGRGELFVHYGEEHITDADGPTLLPKVVMAASRYRPSLVTMSGDKANDGRTEQLALWADVMRRYDAKGIPWFAGVGNHDRKAPPGFPGGVALNGDFGPYSEFFADRPYPMGDAPGYGGGLLPKRRPATDPNGAASHYFVDSPTTRWVFIDNSCWSITGCEPFQSPSGQSPADESQFDFLRRVAGEASATGKLVFVVMHMPTQDPGDQSYREPTALNHTMGKLGGLFVDNQIFERTAAESGVDGVFVGHIKGQFLYQGQGGVPYFIDGGAGGELYTTGPVGTDHGYWHGFRLIRVRRGRLTTDAVPILVKGGIEIVGARRMRSGERQTFKAFGEQPVYNDDAKVPMLELRDPDPVRPNAAAPTAAQQSEPTTTPLESLPNPARIWTSSDRRVLRPVASDSDDPRRNRRTQTADGEFRAVCPGRARLTIASGFEARSIRVTVARTDATPRRCRRRG